MSERANLLAQARKCLNKNEDVKAYFSLSTALQIVLGEENPKPVFAVSFGDEAPELPNKVIHKHFHNDIESCNYVQPFKLDSLLVDCRDNSILDSCGARKDISDKIISTTESPYKTLLLRPHLSIRAAALKAETGFEIKEDLFDAMVHTAPLIMKHPNTSLWREFKRLLRAKLPSAGIEILRKTNILKEILPELEACYWVEQNKKYHKYTVYEHCLFACDACADYDPRLRFAALIHDVGKPPTKGTNKNGITFHKHEVESTKMARRIVKRLRLKKVDGNFVVLLVSNHMYQYDRKWKDSTVVKFIRKVGLHKGFIGKMSKFPLFQLRHADRMGRSLHPITKKQLDFEKRLERTLKGISDR